MLLRSAVFHLAALLAVRTTLAATETQGYVPLRQ